MCTIEPATHAQLLYMLNELPYEEAMILRKELQATYAGYLNELSSYQLQAQKIRDKAR